MPEKNNTKPTIEEACERLIENRSLSESMAQMLDFLRELKMKPGLVSKNTFNCNYKGKKVATFNIGGVGYHPGGGDNIDVVIVSCMLAEKDDLENVVYALPDDLRAEFLKPRTETHCAGGCRAAKCGNSALVKVSEEEYWFCSRFSYIIKNPTPEEFESIKHFIILRREYIDSKK